MQEVKSKVVDKTTVIINRLSPVNLLKRKLAIVLQLKSKEFSTLHPVINARRLSNH